jgi:CRP/FNR family transcriptional regulator, cyclic AMP receptor protein
MISDRGSPKRNEPGRRGGRPTNSPQHSVIHQFGNPELLAFVSNDPHIDLERGQVLFAEGDPPTCMYVVKTGALQIRNGNVVYEDVGPGGIVGEMALVENHQTRSATVYALTDSELVEIDDARFFSFVDRTPSFAITVMQILSRRLRAMDRRYRPQRWT